MCCVSRKQTTLRERRGEERRGDERGRERKDEKESSACFIQARIEAGEKKRAASCAGDEIHADKK